MPPTAVKFIFSKVPIPLIGLEPKATTRTIPGTLELHTTLKPLLSVPVLLQAVETGARMTA